MSDKVRVIVARKWHNPEIVISVTADGIAIAIPLVDFIQALAVELGNPALLLTKAQLLAKLRASSDVICTDMKLLTKQVI